MGGIVERKGVISAGRGGGGGGLLSLRVEDSSPSSLPQQDELDDIGEMDGEADATPSYLAEAAEAAELPAVPSGKVEGDVAVDEFGLPAAPAAAT